MGLGQGVVNSRPVETSSAGASAGLGMDQMTGGQNREGKDDGPKPDRVAS